jgi:hypothetical protein
MVLGAEWRALLDHDWLDLYEPVSAEAVTSAQAGLGAVFPSELRALYRVSDGVYDRRGEWFVVWPLRDVLEFNLLAWQREDATRRELVGFGDNGCGDPFCVPRDGRPGVVIWSAIDAAAHLLADTVDGFWRGWRDGTITT